MNDETPLARVQAFQRAANPNGDYHWPAEEAANIGGVPLYFDDIEALADTDELDAVDVAIRRLRKAEAERDQARAELEQLRAGLRDEWAVRHEDAEDGMPRLVRQRTEQNARALHIEIASYDPTATLVRRLVGDRLTVDASEAPDGTAAGTGHSGTLPASGSAHGSFDGNASSITPAGQTEAEPCPSCRETYCNDGKRPTA